MFEQGIWKMILFMKLPILKMLRKVLRHLNIKYYYIYIWIGDFLFNLDDKEAVIYVRVLDLILNGLIFLPIKQ